MEQKRKQREFSMKYCGGLDDYVVVMKTRQNDTQSELCLSAHLCHADERKRCGQPQAFQDIHEESCCIKM